MCAAYKRGAEEGNAMCQSMLGLALQQGQGVQQDYQHAVEWYLKAAAQGMETNRTLYATHHPPPTAYFHPPPTTHLPPPTKTIRSVWDSSA